MWMHIPETIHIDSSAPLQNNNNNNNNNNEKQQQQQEEEYHHQKKSVISSFDSLRNCFFPYTAHSAIVNVFNVPVLVAHYQRYASGYPHCLSDILHTCVHTIAWDTFKIDATTSTSTSTSTSTLLESSSSLMIRSISALKQIFNFLQNRTATLSDYQFQTLSIQFTYNNNNNNNNINNDNDDDDDSAQFCTILPFLSGINTLEFIFTNNNQENDDNEDDDDDDDDEKDIFIAFHRSTLISMITKHNLPLVKNLKIYTSLQQQQQQQQQQHTKSTSKLHKMLTKIDIYSNLETLYINDNRKK
jgi:hypothetical protein